MTYEFDVVVIGGGPAGENAAAYARDNGLEVALVERELVGGECSYWACMPSKALLRPGEALAASRRVPGAAPAVTGELDVDAMLRSRDAFSSHCDDRHRVDWVESAGTSPIRGHARLAGEQTVHVDTQAVGTRRDGTDGPVTLTLADGTELVADELLVAAGRRPNTGDLGLDTVGREPDRSIETDDALRVIFTDLQVAAGGLTEARRDLHRPGRGRDARRRDHRDRIRHHPRPALPRRPAVPDGQRGLAAAPRYRPRHGVMRDTAAAQRGGGR